MSGTAPVARALARAATARDVDRLRQHEDARLCGWQVDYDNDVLVTVTLTAVAGSYGLGRNDEYVVTLNCDSYDLWPPEVKFVNPQTRLYVVGQDTSALPVIQGLHGFAIHPVFTGFFDAARRDQLVCFSYSRGYYDSGHQPTGRERWQQGRHWLFTTVRYLARGLQPPYYQGRMV